MPRSPRGGGPRGAAAALPVVVVLVQWRRAFGQKALLPAPDVITPDSCVWPDCSKHKVSCLTTKVGTCLGETIMGMPGCDNKHAVCTLGRCNCPEFYCAIPGTKECVPQEVYDGAHPGGYDRGPWLRAFTWLGRPDQYPKLQQIVDRPVGLISPRCIPAVLLLFVGLAVAVVTGMDLCEDLVRCVCCKRPLRPALAESESQNETEKDNLTLVGLEWVDTDPPHRHKNEKEPACMPVAALAGLVVLLSISAVVARLYNWGHTTSILISVLDRFKENAAMLTGESVVLNYTASNLSFTFEQVANCPNPVMSTVGWLAVNSTAELADMVHNLKTEVESVPEYVDSIEQEIYDVKGFAVYLPCTPMIIMSVIAAGMLAEVLFTRYYGSSKTAKYEDKGLAVCAGIFVLVIAIVGVTSAALLSGMIGVAQLCDNIDTNLVEYVHDLGEETNMSSTLVNITRHYIYDDVFNPLGDFTDEIDTYVETVVELVHQYNKSIIEPQALSCKPLNDLHAAEIGNVTKSTLLVARRLFNATNIYPYYDEIVHIGVCNHMSQSLGLFLVQQVVVGLIFFPLCACWTHNYFAHHVSTQKLELPGGTGGSDTTDDDYTEGVTEGGTEDADVGPLKPTAVAPREVQLNGPEQ